MMRLSYLLVLSFLGFFEGFAAESLTAAQAIQRLKEGNDRYVHDQLEHPNRESDRREAVSAKQYPFAVIVGCSDSRVSTEIVFDQGIGDLFIVRVAGNVIGDLELESIDFGALVLKAVCVIVLGHENCGAVNAVIEGNAKDIESIARLIQPAIKDAKRAAPEHVLSTAIKDNAKHMKEFLLSTKVIKKLVKERKISVHAAYYHLDSGVVEWLDEP
jgi:carbonic anhydrase